MKSKGSQSSKSSQSSKGSRSFSISTDFTSKCFDVPMQEENDIKQYIEDDNDNLVFIDKINKTAFCSNRKTLKTYYLDNIVFPCNKVFSNLFMVNHNNRHAATNEKVIEEIPYVKLKNLGIGYYGVVTLESFHNLVINGKQRKYNIEIPKNPEKQSLVATIDRNLVEKYKQANVQADAVSNAHCQEGTHVKILKIVDPSNSNYKDTQKDKFSIPLTEQELRAKTRVITPSGDERRNFRHRSPSRMSNNNNNNSNSWHPYPALLDIERYGQNAQYNYDEEPQITNQQLSFSNSIFGQEAQRNNINHGLPIVNSFRDRLMLNATNTPRSASRHRSRSRSRTRSRSRSRTRRMSRSRSNSIPNLQPLARNLFSQIPAAQDSVLNQSSRNNSSQSSRYSQSPILNNGNIRRRSTTRSNSNNRSSNNSVGNLSTQSQGRNTRETPRHMPRGRRTRRQRRSSRPRTIRY